jgi:hypothetical protein
MTSKLHWSLARFVDSLGFQAMSICIPPSPKVWSRSLTRKLGLVSSFPPFRRDRACGKKDELVALHDTFICGTTQRPYLCSGKLEDEPQIIGGVMITPRYNNENGCLRHDCISLARVNG